MPSKMDAGTYSFDVTVDNLLQAGMTIDKTVKIDGVVEASATGVAIAADTTHTETITGYVFTYGLHNVTVTVDYTAGSYSGTKTIVKYVWITIPEDIGGSTWYDDAGYASYPYKNQLPTPDFRVDKTDLHAVNQSFGAYPGHVKWNPVADINHDYKIDLHDLLAVASMYGWSGGPVVWDIAVSSVTPSKTVVCQGFSMFINVTVENQGRYTETFNVTVYANTTIIGTTTNIILASGNSTTTTLIWNTTGFAKGNYTISAYATPVPGETDTTDNTLADGLVLVTIPGDVNGDGKVRIDDILAVALAFGSNCGDPEYEANLDINGDCKIRVDDVLIAALNFGQGP